MSYQATEAVLQSVHPFLRAHPEVIPTLLGLAQRADEHGRNAYPSAPTLAAYVKKSVRTVQRHLRLLRDGGLIREGDQGRVANHSPDRRPVVYDMNMAALTKIGRGDMGITPLANGVTWASQRGDTGVVNGVTWASPKESLEEHKKGKASPAAGRSESIMDTRSPVPGFGQRTEGPHHKGGSARVDLDGVRLQNVRSAIERVSAHGGFQQWLVRFPERATEKNLRKLATEFRDSYGAIGDDVELRTAVDALLSDVEQRIAELDEPAPIDYAALVTGLDLSEPDMPIGVEEEQGDDRPEGAHVQARAVRAVRAVRGTQEHAVDMPARA